MKEYLKKEAGRGEIIKERNCVHKKLKKILCEGKTLRVK